MEQVLSTFTGRHLAREAYQAAKQGVKVTPDGAGVVSHAGAELLRELAQETGLVQAWDAVVI